MMPPIQTSPAVRTAARRRGLVGATAMVAALALAACGSTDTAPADGSAPSNAAATSSGSDVGQALPAAEGTTQYPLTLKSAWGESTLPARPKRIAVVEPSGSDVELLAAMKVTPVMASSVVMDRAPWAGKAIPGKVEKVFDADADTTLQFEQIAAMHPDLIVTTDVDLKNDYAKLKDIAPVVASPKADLEGLSWRERIAQLGQALDLTKAAESAIKTHDDAIAQVRGQYPQFAGKTLTYAVQYGKSGLIYDSKTGSDTEKFFTSLGFAPNPLAAKVPKDGQISAENLKLLDADALVISDNTDGNLEAQLTGQPLYKQLHAVKNNNVAILAPVGDGKQYSFAGKTHDGNLPWALAVPGPLADVYAAQQFGPILATIVR